MKMPNHIDHEMFAPCGMNCMVCYVHLKKKKPCHGCLVSETNQPERCKNCAIKQCAREKGHLHCYHCEEFPCKRISNLEKSYRKRYQVSLIEHSRRVQAHGLEAFFQREQLRWSCPECRGVISLHDQECSECGKKLSEKSSVKPQI